MSVELPVAVTASQDAQDSDEDAAPEGTWRQYLQDSGGEEAEAGGASSGSGEDSDELPEGTDAARRQNDLDVLLREQQRGFRAPMLARRGPEASSSPATASCTAKEAHEQHRVDEDGEDGHESRSSSPTSVQAASTASARPTEATKSSKLSFVSRLFGKSSAPAPQPVEEGVSLMNQDISDLDDDWFSRWSNRLSDAGLKCTKVATNGRPYERRLHVDCRNFSMEVREGRTGTTGIMLDDLVDISQGLASPEFAKFCSRFKSQAGEGSTEQLSKLALVLKTPARNFSFLFFSETQRDTVGRFIIYLLRTRRGVVARSKDADGASTKPPLEGHGKVSYPNNSVYEGDFQNYMRHGNGALTLSDGTKYECQWRNDERHGRGRELWADGTVFVGSYAKGMRSGHGVMTWPEGSRYSGQFERGRANGEGELVRTDGSVYRGRFCEDCMSGEGRMQWKDGVVYTGQFAQNRREGFGKMVWTSGRWKSYEGHWKDGVQHGHGTLFDQSNTAFSGTFANGKLERWDDDP